MELKCQITILKKSQLLSVFHGEGKCFEMSACPDDSKWAFQDMDRLALLHTVRAVHGQGITANKLLAV